MRFNDIRFKGLLDCYLRDYSERVVQSLVSGATRRIFDTNAFARGHLPHGLLPMSYLWLKLFRRGRNRKSRDSFASPEAIGHVEQRKSFPHHLNQLQRQ